MTISDIREAGKSTLQTSMDEKGRRAVSWTRTFTGVSDSATTDTEYHARVAISTTGTVDGEVITEGTGHPLNPWITVESINVVRNGQVLYEYTVNYKSPKFQGDGSEPQAPDLEPPDISFSTATTDEPIDEDVSGDPLATATGELYTGLTRSVSDLVANISKKFSIFDPDSFYDYIDKVNSDTFLNFPAGTGRVTSISATRVYQEFFFYWNVGVQISFRRPYQVEAAKAWYKRVRHEGYRRWNNGERGGVGNLEPVPCVDGHGEPATTPQPLNEDGTQNFDDPTTGHWLTFQVYETVAFSGMNLGV